MESGKNGVVIFNYTDKEGNQTTRTAIVVYPPSETMLTIDVSDLDDTQVVEMFKMWQGYQEYLDAKKEDNTVF